MKWHEKLGYKLWLFWKGLRFLKVGQSILTVFGALWLVVEILTFFNKVEFSNELKELWWLFLIIGLIIITYNNWPKLIFNYKVKNRDVSISIRIADIFSVKGALIIPINNRLDCDNQGIIQRSNSILRFFIQKIYNNIHSHLQTDIGQHIEDNADWYSSFSNVPNQGAYKIGTVVPIYRDEKQYYMLCSSTLNQQNRSKTTEDDLRNSLNELWEYLIHNGSKDNLILPIIGTGRGRITLTREEVIKETVLSFLVSLSTDSYCEQLTICIHPKDIKTNKMDMDEILAFTKRHCNNTNYASNINRPEGREIT